MEKIALQIPTPCHENWDKMTPTQQGRFCSSCEKQVIDFTLMSDAQVLRYLDTQQAGTTCGRVFENQLNRDMEAPVLQPRKTKKIWHLLTMLLLMFSKSGEVKAQAKVGRISQPVRTPKPQIVGEIAAVSPKKISGVVKDEQGKPVANAAISFEQGSPSAVTDAYGVFVLTVNSTTSSIAIQAPGYEQKSFPISDRKFYNIQLRRRVVQHPPVIMGKMIAPRQ